mmetsp:Transcript_10199/g.18570  ORF Transcript_10199/g.18570 Transcript_10199/m.18570 type:complete len:612 (-) Transcript_10199:133-1968(-)
MLPLLAISILYSHAEAAPELTCSTIDAPPCTSEAFDCQVLFQTNRLQSVKAIRADAIAKKSHDVADNQGDAIAKMPLADHQGTNAKQSELSNFQDLNGIRRGGIDFFRMKIPNVETWSIHDTLQVLCGKCRSKCVAFLLFLVLLFCIASSRASSKTQENHSLSDEKVTPMTTAQVLSKGCIICIPCLCGGYNLAITGTDIASIQSTFYISVGMVGWVASSSCVGCIVGALVNASLMDIVGRKGSHRYLTLMLYFGQLLMFSAPTFLAFLWGRFLMGVACGGLATLAPVYLAEIAPMKHRGLLVSLTEQSLSGGLVFGFMVAAFPSWGFREHGVLGIIFPVVSLAFASGLAESPRWLIRKGRVDEARVILQHYVPDAEEVEHTLKAAAERNAVNAEKNPILNRSVLSALVLLWRNRCQLFLPALLMFAEEMVGIEVSDDYCVQFLQEAGAPRRSLVVTATTGMVALKAVVLMISGCAIDRWGRKPPLLFSLGGQAVTLAGFAFLFHTGAWQSSLTIWILYNLFYGAGLGNVCIVVMAEAFPDANVRGVGVAFCYILNRLVAAILTGIYPWQRSVIGVQNIVYLWSISAVVAFIVTAMFMKESSGTMLEHTAS